MSKKYLVSVFDNEHTLVKAFEKVLEKNVKVEEVYTPYPIHEILHGMKKKTRISHAAFFFGLFASLGLLAFMYYAAVIDWPLNFGGKPFNTFPSFIVVNIVATILSITVLTLFTFSVRAKIWPGKKANIIDYRATDDKFIVVIDKDELGEEAGMIDSFLKENGAIEVYEK